MTEHVTLASSLVVFVISLLIGAFGIYVGARVVTNHEDYTYAIVTALVGALAWAVVAFLVGWIPFLGPILAFVAYLGIINWRYPGGWFDALAITLIAWIAVLVVLYVLSVLDVTTPEAFGVPGT